MRNSSQQKTPTGGESVVRTESVTKVYQQGEVLVHALNKVSLAVHRGDFLALAGPSGSGKTTLLNLIGGLTAPSEGDVFVEETNLGEISAGQRARIRLERIGFIFQSYNLIPVLTAYENAEFVLMLQKVPEKKRHDQVMSLLERVGLKGLEHRYPREMSGGQQQRVAIARAIVGEPAIILADEPTANLDSKTSDSLLDTMEELNRERQATFIFSTHDPNVMRRARTLVFLKDGRIDEITNGRDHFSKVDGK